MKTVRPLFVSTYPPAECGVGAFSRDLADAVDLVSGEAVSSVAAICKTGSLPATDPRVIHVIHDDRPDAYRLAAEVANDGPADVVSLQHEIEPYTGQWSGGIIEFVDACDKPIATTFHNLVTEPDATSRSLVRKLVVRSDCVVLTTQLAAQLLETVYHVSGSLVRVIPRGLPEARRESDDVLKARLGLEGKRVISTCGLIHRGQGFEYMIDALPQVVAAYPDTVYLIAGFAHPLISSEEGEDYRENLGKRARALGVGDHLRVLDGQLDFPELFACLQCADVYLTPYPGTNQITNGTLAYAMAAGRAVVSTPYLHAEEWLADGRGLLVPFARTALLADALIRFLSDAPFRVKCQRRASEYARPMFWPNVGRQYLELFDQLAAARDQRLERRFLAAFAVRQGNGLPAAPLTSRV